MRSVEIGIRKRGQHGYVVLIGRENGRKVVRSTGETVLLSQWDALRKRPKNNPAQAMRIEEAKIEAMRNGFPVKENRYWKTGTSDLIVFYERLIETRAANPKCRAQTIATFRRTLRKLRAFSQHMRQKALPFASIGLDFFEHFTAWMFDQGAGDAYVAKTIGHIRDAMEEALERRLHQNTDFRSKKWRVKVATGANNPIYLTEQEIQGLAAVELPSGMGRARDAFLIRCYTGLRFGDTWKVNMAAIHKHENRQYVTVLSQKTDKKTSIEIFPELQHLIEKYPTGVPKHTPQYENKAIKCAAKKAGLERWAQVTTHTARRSFATNAYLNAVKNNTSYYPIMYALGHSSETMLKKYIRLSSLENAALLRRIA